MPQGPHTFRDPYLEVNGTDVSEAVRSVTLSDTINLNDSTAGSAETMRNVPGLKDYSISVELNQTYDTTNGGVDVEQTFWDLRGTAFALKLRPRKGEAMSAANPEYRSSSVLISEFQPAGGGVGDMHTTSVSIMPGNAIRNELTRHTA